MCACLYWQWVGCSSSLLAKPSPSCILKKTWQFHRSSLSCRQYWLWLLVKKTNDKFYILKLNVCSIILMSFRKHFDSVVLCRQQTRLWCVSASMHNQLLAKPKKFWETLLTSYLRSTTCYPQVWDIGQSDVNTEATPSQGQLNSGSPSGIELGTRNAAWGHHHNSQIKRTAPTHNM